MTKKKPCAACAVYENTVKHLQEQLNRVAIDAIPNQQMAARLAAVCKESAQHELEIARLRKQLQRAKESARKYYELWRMDDVEDDPEL